MCEDALIIKLTKSTKSHDTAILLGIIHKELKRELAQNTISLIPDYTSKHFTHVKDTLPVLSGLASRMPGDLCGPYLTRLSEHNLGRQLLWEFVRGTQCTRPQIYIAPPSPGRLDAAKWSGCRITILTADMALIIGTPSK